MGGDEMMKTGRVCNARARILVALALVAAAALGLGGCASAGDVGALEARVAALEAKLKALETGGAELKVTRVRIVDKDGKERAMFGLREEDNAPALQLQDTSPRNRMLLRLHEDGTPILVLWGVDGKGTAYLSVPGEGPPNLMFFDKDGGQPVKLP